MSIETLRETVDLYVRRKISRESIVFSEQAISSLIDVVIIFLEKLKEQHEKTPIQDEQQFIDLLCAMGFSKLAQVPSTILDYLGV
ncbi:hypothetical protein RCL1_001758 [Eukaryota sp. TZLM3-RCL]